MIGDFENGVTINTEGDDEGDENQDSCSEWRSCEFSVGGDWNWNCSKDGILITVGESFENTKNRENSLGLSVNKRETNSDGDGLCSFDITCSDW